MWLCFCTFFSLNIYLLIYIYLHCSKICVERQQAGLLGWEGVAAARQSRRGPAQGLSPEKFHSCAEREPGSCREAPWLLLRFQAWV